MSRNTVKVSFRPHQGTPDKCPGGQVRLIALTLVYKTVVVAVGRRFGKTQGALMAILEHYRQEKWKGREFRAAYCAPTNRLVAPVFDEALKMFGGLVLKSNRTEGWIRLKGVNGSLGATISFWSLEEADNHRGNRLDFCVIDEATDVRESAYVSVLRPMLIDTGGHILVIGTPRPDGVGFQWFRREYLRGMDEGRRGYASMKGPTEGNPYMDRDAVAEERAGCPSKAIERSEYDADFVDAEGAVFERLEEAFVLEPRMEGLDRAWLPGFDQVGKTVVIGYDPGRHDDWGVISGFDLATGHQVYVERMRSMTFRAQLGRLSHVRRLFNNAVVYADANGMGEALFEELAFHFGDGAVPRKWNHARKEDDVMRGMSLFQAAVWKFLKVPWQQECFYAYTRTRLPVMGYRYEASPGSHDDPVSAALMIAHRIPYGDGGVAEEAKPRQMFDEKTGQVDPEYWFEDAERRVAEVRDGRWI